MNIVIDSDSYNGIYAGTRKTIKKLVIIYNVYDMRENPPILHECVSLKLKRIHVIVTRKTIKTH